jgi:FixJ family two-component response regulator
MPRHPGERLVPGKREQNPTSPQSGWGEADHTIVRVVDDDPALLRSMTLLLETAGFRVNTYGSAEALLSDRDTSPGCAVLDLHMEGSGGLELQQAMLKAENPLPVIFLTGRGDVHSSVRAMKRGAVDFLTKPVSVDDLLDAVRRAVALDLTARRGRRDRAQLRARFDALTPREREVFTLVARGLLNKQVAAALGISERTIKAHRANVLRKMGAASVADLARAADRLAV